MSLINEYLEVLKKSGNAALESELLRLIGEYNKLRSTYLFVYVSAIGKQIPNIALDQADYYIIRDFLSDKTSINKAVKQQRKLCYFSGSISAPYLSWYQVGRKAPAL